MIKDFPIPEDIVPSTVSFRSICTFRVAGELYGIDSNQVERVLGESNLHPVPLGPASLAGALSHRGDVLAVVCSRRILGQRQVDGEHPVVVLRDPGSAELFGLAVDAVESVVEVSPADFHPNPCTLDAVHAALYRGSYFVGEGLLMMLDPARLAPSTAFQRTDPNAGGSPCARLL